MRPASIFFNIQLSNSRVIKELGFDAKELEKLEDVDIE